MESYKDETLDILRFIANYMKEANYKGNEKIDNMTILEEGLNDYTLNKLRKYGLNVDKPKYYGISLRESMSLLDKFIPKQDKDSFFFQYLNSINLILSAMQNKEIELNMFDGYYIFVFNEKEDSDNIHTIFIGERIKPKDRAMELLNFMKQEYTKEISK